MNTQSGQAPEAVMMVRPVKFGFNEQTAETNTFQQQDSELMESEIQENALKEFNNFVAKLESCGIEVVVFDDTLEPHKPDSIFPNNWISFHHDGTVVLYPMQAANRRLERRGEFLVHLQKDYSFNVRHIIDLTRHEDNNKFLEGTGSIVFDYKNKIGYANISPRTDIELLQQLSDTMGHDFVVFNAVDKKGNPIYHTNVVMCIGERFAVVCTECMPVKVEKDAMIKSLEKTGHEIVDISFDQLAHFAGNMMEVQNKAGEHFLVLSQTAYNSLNAAQLQVLEKYATLIPVKIDIIEKHGGGSVRCMMAGVFLPRFEN